MYNYSEFSKIQGQSVISEKKLNKILIIFEILATLKPEIIKTISDPNIN